MTEPEPSELESLHTELTQAVSRLASALGEVRKANNRLLHSMQGDSAAQEYVEPHKLIREAAIWEFEVAQNEVFNIRTRIDDAHTRALTEATLTVADEAAKASRVTARATVILAVATVALIAATVLAAWVARG